jgi:exodeoxyribonuclease VIII
MTIFNNISREDYDNLPGINWSKLKRGLGKTAAHINAPSTGGDKPAYKFGRAFHHAVLQPELFISEWEVVGGKTTTKAGAITEVEKADIMAMAEAAKGLHRDLISHQECAFTWNIGKHRCKALVDGIYDNDWLVDLKSTQNASPGSFSNEILKYKYHGQIAWYLNGILCNNLPLKGAAILAVEKVAPYSSGFYFLDEEWVSLGEKLYTNALNILEENSPATYGVQDLCVPEWASEGASINDEGGIDL